MTRSQGTILSTDTPGQPTDVSQSSSSDSAAAGQPPAPPTPSAPEQPNTQLLVLKDKVQRYLTDLVCAVEITADGRFTFHDGSTQVSVTCSMWAQDRTVASIMAPILLGVPATSELFEYIATNANRYLFGHLSALRDDDGTVGVLLTHELLGDFLDPDELKIAVGSVALTANDLGDEMKARFGGKRFHDEVA
jgi:hypothetical protein